jgi:hypothetical protein
VRAPRLTRTAVPIRCPDDYGSTMALRWRVRRWRRSGAAWEREMPADVFNNFFILPQSIKKRCNYMFGWSQI